MPDLREQLAPYYGKLCTFQVPDETRQLMSALGLTVDDGGAMRLYLFDWKPLDSERKDEIREAAGQDDYRIFAVVNPAVVSDDLMTVVRGEHEGFLMYSADGQNRIYLGDGGMETFTKDVPRFVAGLAT